MANHAVVIVAAGRGARMGDEGGPKQYRSLGAKSVLQTTIECFLSHPDIGLIQVVIHADDQHLYDENTVPSEKLAPPVVGGATRQESCFAGIKALPEWVENVLIHDAARPFVPHSVTSHVLDGITSGTAVIPASAIADTLKRADEDGDVVDTVDRTGLFAAQTPQGFIRSEILTSHIKAFEADLNTFTDDAAVAEWAGSSVRLVNGDRNNFKITTVDDFKAARERVSAMASQNVISDVRSGSGYDVHTLGPGTEVILCGHTIPHTQSLQGHSDADVGLHSLTDALLGTIGAGDIGSHFPPTDPKWKGAPSDQFLAHAVELVRQHGGVITNLDVTIICEAPKIGPHRDPMRSRIAEICGIVDLTRISVKATTNEKIGFIGREEGIAALATATVSFGAMPHV